ncbi:Autophagy-related protein 29 [Cyphellophora attinorum]|uniref:Autophagy-related protein 29 n=1 Tax=Cyphellophora attinorum TaxID=1664694 RepID=A0A0N1HVK9_9EURO|nr:Autophagy-related protein 29 [Phialophora attinorum]KPI43872.1 Autophagy-related protein 29 [Phialophora attinorum]
MALRETTITSTCSAEEVGNRQSATPSPAPVSVTSSVVGAQPMKRVGSGGSRAPSRLSTQHAGSPTVPETGTPPTPARSRTSLPLRGPPAPSMQPRTSSNSKPLSRQTSKEVVFQNPLSRRGSVQPQLSRSPGQVKDTGHESDDEPEEQQMTQSKFITRRSNPSSLHRRSVSLRKDKALQSPKPTDDDDEDDSFLAFASDIPDNTSSQQTMKLQQDPSATLRGGLGGTALQRPKTHRRSTSEKIASPTKTQASAGKAPVRPQALSASTSSSDPNTGTSTSTQPSMQPHRAERTAKTLSPRQQATLASAGLSPRRQGSESSPSMGSSFSDLDDTSVTQSALEEALMSGMGGTTMASRVSGISQALKSRYFDARQNERQGEK